MNIAFYERTYNQQNGENISRIGFQQKVKDVSIPFYNTWSTLTSKLNDISILFYHGNDKDDLLNTDASGDKTLKTGLNEKVLIEFGGNSTEVPGNINNSLKYINYNDLEKRLNEIKEKLSTLNCKDISQIIHIVWNISPFLEAKLIIIKRLQIALRKKKGWVYAKKIILDGYENRPKIGQFVTMKDNNIEGQVAQDGFEAWNTFVKEQNKKQNNGQNGFSEKDIDTLSEELLKPFATQNT